MGLNSKSTIRIVDLLCEGPIEGIVGNRKGVFLDETALRSTTNEDLVRETDAKYNFKNGTRGQGYLPQGKNEVSNVINVGKEVGSGYREILDSEGTEVKSRDYGNGFQVVRITDTDVDSIDLIFTIPALFSTAKEGLVKGQLFDARVFWDVFIQAEGSGKAFKRVKVKSSNVSEEFSSSTNVFYIEGISTTNYQYKISDIALEGKGPWNIRVEKYPQSAYKGVISHTNSNAGDIDEDIFRASFREFEEVDKRTPLSSGRRNTLIWSSIVEKKNLRSAYPYSALVGMSISTEEFQSLPTRAYKVRGRKVKVPHNAVARDDGSLKFNGSFNGKLGSSIWTTCPVCIFYDLLVNNRYGAGSFVDPSNLSWVDLYPLCRYANEQIGGEPRFACNIQVSSQAQAYTVLQDFASIFRGMMYWQSNIIQVTADHGNLDGTDIDPVHIFSNSSVIGGIFTYSGSSLKTRSTSIRVRYSDPQNFYKPNIVCIEDSALISKYGYQTKEVLGFGCTSKKQARRLARWMMKSEELDQNTVTFAVGLDGALVFPGQVFAIQDEMRAGARLSGRIASSTSTSIVTDQDISVLIGPDKTLTCVLRDGTVETRAIDAGNSAGTTITVTSAFSSNPLEQAVYSIASNDVREQKFRCLSVADNADGTFAVVAVQHNDSIYSAAEQDEELEFEDVTVFDAKPPKPII